MVPDRREVPAMMVRWRTSLAAHAVQPEPLLLRPAVQPHLRRPAVLPLWRAEAGFLLFCKLLSAFPAIVRSLTGIIKTTLLSAELSGGTLKEGP